MCTRQSGKLQKVKNSHANMKVGIAQNCSDCFAMAVVKNGIVVGHFPQLFSAACVAFLKRARVILCRIIGCRTYTKDLPQGGLEILCQYLFCGRPTEVAKVKKVLR